MCRGCGRVRTEAPEIFFEKEKDKAGYSPSMLQYYLLQKVESNPLLSEL